MLSFLQDMASEDELRGLPGRKAHRLTGDAKGRWSLAVSRNWRLTFVVNAAEAEIIDLMFEDYH